jgi:phenylacetic acid degradation protein
VMDRTEIGDESVVGALCFVKADTQIPPRSIVVGNPHKIVKQVSDEMVAWKTEGTKIYMGLPADAHATLKPCEPLREVPADRQKQEGGYKTWNETK